MDDRNAALATSLIVEPRAPVLLISLPLALHVPHAHSGYLSRIDPDDLLRHPFQNYVLQFHHPLHLVSGYLLTWFQLPASPASFLNRTTRMLTTAVPMFVDVSHRM